MNINEARNRYGGLAALSRSMGVSRPTAYKWVELGHIPAEFQALIEIQTEGELRADRRRTGKAPKPEQNLTVEV